jgi:AcrR family transcriptional regulator
MGLREEKRTATREQIISTAIELFTERGYEATTIDDITKAARVAKGTFYYHFECKEELVLAFGQNAMLKNATRIQANLAKGQAPLTALRDFLDSAAEWLTQNPTLANICFHYAVNHYQQSKKRHEPSFRRVIEGFLVAGQEKGQIRNDSSVQELAQMFSVLYLYSVMSWLEMPETSIKNKLHRCLNIFLEGALSKPIPTL